MKRKSLLAQKCVWILMYLLFDFLIALSQRDTLMFRPVTNPVLEQYNIRSITTGKDGKLWLSTDRGLLSFDGNEVKVFEHSDNDAASLSSNNVLKTYIDFAGNLFIMEVSHLIDYLDVKTGKVAPLNIHELTEDFRLMSFPSAYADLLIDNDESIWIAAYNIGLIHYNKSSRHTASFHLHNDLNAGSNSIYAIEQDHTNSELLWLGTENGIYSFNKKTNELKRNFRCTSPVNSVAQDLQVTKISDYNTDTIWFTVQGKGMGCYDKKTGIYKVFPSANKATTNNTAELNIIQIIRKSKTEYYFASEHSLPGLFNTQTHLYDFEALTSQNLPAPSFNQFLIDSADNFWCLLYNRLFTGRSSRNKFALVSLNEKKGSIAGDIFKTIATDNTRKYYYAVFEKSNEILVLDDMKNPVKSIPFTGNHNNPSATPVTKIYDIGFDHDNRLWACGNILWVYDHVSEKMIPADKLYPGLTYWNQPFQNMVFRQHDIYLQPLSAACRAVYHVNTDKLLFDSIPFPAEMISDNVNTFQPGKRIDRLVADRKGKYVYMGYSRNSVMGYNNGLIQYDLINRQGRKITRINLNEHEDFTNMFKYALDDSDHIWVETEKGIKVYEPENLKVIKSILPEGERFGTQLYNIEGAGIMCRLYSGGLLLYDYKNNRQFHLTLSDGLISYMNTGIACVNNTFFIGGSNYIQHIPLASILGKNKDRQCYLSAIQLFNQLLQTDTLPQYLHQLTLPHDKNFITLIFSSIEFDQSEALAYRYQLVGVDKDWVVTNSLKRTISYNDLKPGQYTFNTAVKNFDGTWNNSKVNLQIEIIPAWWQTMRFKIACVLLACFLAFLFTRWRIQSVRRQEREKSKIEKEILELEARALRAQMNPHFVFNCLNSIKSLIQVGDKDKAVTYLTTFSKLIRTIFQNSDQREITLFDELETCRLYTKLESMRFGDKFNYHFNIESALDLKSVMIPALIIQPFIENAIWHGIMPKEEGGTVDVTVSKENNAIRCSIDDDGVGREVSIQNKFKGDPTHQSKGVHLTQNRLDLDNMLNEREASLEIIDKKNSAGNSCGTRVVLTFNDY